MTACPVAKAPETKEQGQAADQSFSHSTLSPNGVVTLPSIWVFLGRLWVGVGVAPCLRPSASGPQVHILTALAHLQDQCLLMLTSQRDP